MSTQAITEQIAEYFKTQPVLKAWLFGSVARGEQTADSDVLEKSTGRRIDLVEDGCLLPFAVESANRDKILIYERRV